jgi:hypothetical protein
VVVVPQVGRLRFERLEPVVDHAHAH